jgi:hypothetical protein
MVDSKIDLHHFAELYRVSGELRLSWILKIRGPAFARKWATTFSTTILLPGTCVQEGQGLCVLFTKLRAD